MKINIENKNTELQVLYSQKITGSRTRQISDAILTSSEQPIAFIHKPSILTD